MGQGFTVLLCESVKFYCLNTPVMLKVQSKSPDTIISVINPIMIRLKKHVPLSNFS